MFRKVGLGLWACGAVGWQGVLCVLCVQCPASRLNMCTGCPTSGLNMCTRWPARGPPAQAVYGPVWGPVRALCVACMGLCSGGSSILPPVAVASLEVQLRPD